MRRKNKTIKIAYAAVMSAALLALQVALVGLPNIEVVSLLVMVYTLFDPVLAAAAIAVFVVLEGLLYGFHLWWISYLYVWYVLFVVTLLARKWLSPLPAALICGLYGLFFGVLCSIPYFFIGGGVAYIIAGIPFDIAHCVGNFVLTLLLFRPLDRLFGHLKTQMNKSGAAPGPGDAGGAGSA